VSAARSIPPPDRRRHAAPGLALVLLVLIAVGAPPQPARAATTEVRVALGHLGPPMRAGFAGLSLEMGDLPQVAQDGSRGNLVALLRGIGPGVLRFGGSTADHTTAYSPGGPVPPWARTRILPGHFDLLRALLRRSGWGAVLTADLGHLDPAAAAQMLAAASQRLGPRLVGYEIGNEANAFGQYGERAKGWGYPQYRLEVDAYRQAISAVAPALPLLGPDTATPGDPAWVARFAQDERPALLTPHFYPTNDCFGTVPTLDQLLGPQLMANQEGMLRLFATVGRFTRIPVRLGETNNVACAGTAGVSDTMGAALWAVRYAITALRAGLVGLDFHTLPGQCGSYTSFCTPSPDAGAAGLLRAQPEYYALLLLRGLVGRHLARATISPPAPGLTADAFADRSRRRLDVVVVNTTATGTAPATVRLRVGRRPASGTILRLQAPGLAATSGITFGGAAVAPDGRWRPAMARRVRPSRDGSVRISVPAGSAALVQLIR
jgi:hypothetical protein